MSISEKSDNQITNSLCTLCIYIPAPLQAKCITKFKSWRLKCSFRGFKRRTLNSWMHMAVIYLRICYCHFTIQDCTVQCSCIYIYIYKWALQSATHICLTNQWEFSLYGFVSNKLKHIWIVGFFCIAVTYEQLYCSWCLFHVVVCLWHSIISQELKCFSPWSSPICVLCCYPGVPDRHLLTLWTWSALSSVAPLSTYTLHSDVYIPPGDVRPGQSGNSLSHGGLNSVWGGCWKAILSSKRVD